MYQTGVELINKMFQVTCADNVIKRKNDAIKLLNYYDGCQTDYIIKNIKNGLPNNKDVLPVGLNIVRKIVRNIAMVYLRDAVRSISGKQNAAIFSEIEESAALAVKMKLANQYSKLFGTVIAWPNWRNGHMELDILTPDILDVETGLTPEDLKAVQITRYLDTGNLQEVRYSLWTAESVAVLDANGRTLSEEPNPYGILPFIPIWGSPVTDTFWQYGVYDLLMIQDEINRLLTALSYIVRLQGYSMAVVKGVDISAYKGKIEFGPGKMIALDNTSSDFNFAAPNAPIEQILFAIDSLIKWAAVTSGLPASAITTTTQEMSGISRLVANAELEEMRRDDIALFNQYERRLFDVYRVIWNVHNPARQISADAIFSINFADPRPYIDPRSQVDIWEKLIEMGLFSPVDVMQEIDPDLSRSEAIERLNRVQADIQDYSTKWLKDPDGYEKTAKVTNFSDFLTRNL